jgi:hypothetical protein
MKTTNESIHPAANIFPMMDDDRLKKLAEDIRLNGQRDAVVYFKQQVLDGRNRLAACALLGIEPQTCEIDDEDNFDPIAYVLSANLHRRELKTSQKAVCAARLCNMPHGGDRSKTPNDALTIDKCAELFSIGSKSVERALAVLRGGSTEVIKQCECGALSVALASKLVDEVADKKEQTKLAKEGKAAIKEYITPKSDYVSDEVTEEEIKKPAKPRMEIFKALWASADEVAKAAIRAFVLDAA